MTMDTAATAALDVWFGAAFAETITYAGSSIPAVRGPERVSGRRRLLEITVKAADVPAPAYRDAVTVGGEDWTVHVDDSDEARIEGDGYSWRLTLMRAEVGGF